MEMEKKPFEVPTCNVEELMVEDIITTSPDNWETPDL